MSRAADRARALWAVASDQAGMLSRGQLRQADFDADKVRNQIRAARWQPWGRKVVALHTGPLSAEQVTWFAVLDGGEACVLAGLSALHRHGLSGFPVDRIQTAVPVGGRAARHDLFIRRQSRRLNAAAVHPTRLPPTMRLETAVVDALEHITLPLRGCALLAALVQQRLVRADDLAGTLRLADTLPNLRLYQRVAHDIQGGAQSLVEVDFFKLARRAGIWRPVGQSVRIDRHGRRRYLDADFKTFAVEVDGAVHLKPLNWWDDMFRQNDIVLRAKPVLRFPAVGIYLSRDDVIEQLREAARRWPL